MLTHSSLLWSLPLSRDRLAQHLRRDVSQMECWLSDDRPDAAGHDLAARAGISHALVLRSTRIPHRRFHIGSPLEQIRAAITDAEVVQAIGRGRGVNRTAANPLTVWVAITFY